jgi:hypothetical protein
MAEYKSAIVSYLDILGFRELVEYRTADDIHKLLQLIKGVSKMTIGTRNQQGEIQTHTATQTFSDLVIRRVEYEGTSFVRYLSAEMNVLASIQFHMLIERKTMIRGGMSKGLFYMDDDFVFGPAMVRSYELEQSAVFPRIIIDRNLIRELRDEIRDAFQSTIRQGEDGIFFIDYLNFLVRKSLSPTDISENHEMLTKHKEAAEHKLEELSRKKDPVRQKAVWLAKYHNSVIEDNYGINIRASNI